MSLVPLYSKPWFQTILISGDYIIYAGDMGREMYCVRRGQVQVIGEDEITVVDTLGPGAYFGEVKNEFNYNINNNSFNNNNFIPLLLLNVQLWPGLFALSCLIFFLLFVLHLHICLVLKLKSSYWGLTHKLQFQLE